MKKEDLLTAIDQANITFKKIMVNYPGLLGYLVLSSPYGQCGLTGDPLQILKEFPAMISDSEVKDNVIKLLETIRELESKLPPTLSVALKSGKTSDNVLRLA